MKADGVWKIELLGAYGWEPVSTAFLQDGTYRAGSNEHYSLGTYTVDNEKVSVQATMVTYKGSRTLFGESRTRHDINFEGTLSGETINGFAKDDRGEFLVRFRATRLAEIS